MQDTNQSPANSTGCITKQEIIEKLKPFLKNETNRKIIKCLGLGWTPRQISNSGICSYSESVARCRAIANSLRCEYGSFHRASEVLSAFVVRQGGTEKPY